MPSAIRDPTPSDAAFVESGGTLSELPQFFSRFAQYHHEFVIHDDGFRGHIFRYPDIARMAVCFAARLRANRIQKGDAVMIWSESRPGWIAALWGCLLEGVIVVPVEPQSSSELFRKLEQKVKPRLVLLGDRVPNVPYATELPVWRLSEIELTEEPINLEPVPLYADDVAEIVFTSGTTAEPKGVIITHRNLAAQLRPIEDQIAPYRKYVRPFAPLRILNLLPMSHLFGQSLATFVPPLIPASVVFISSTSPHEIAASRSSSQSPRFSRSCAISWFIASPRPRIQPTPPELGLSAGGDFGQFIECSAGSSAAWFPEERRCPPTWSDSGRTSASWWCKAMASPRPRQ